MAENHRADNAGKPAAKQHPRLPCRGCLPDCRNYAICEGARWRIAPDGTLSAPLHRGPAYNGQ